jgi:hypothetical protein
MQFILHRTPVNLKTRARARHVVARLNEHPPTRTLRWVGYTNLRTYMETSSELAYIPLDGNYPISLTPPHTL